MQIVGLLAAGAVALASNPGPEGVRKAEKDWSAAFVTGDRAYLEALLDRSYVAVNAAGVARDKATIVESAQKYAAAHPGATPMAMGPSSTIKVMGTTAIVRHTSSTEVSVDVFHYGDGRWRALYSQHTTVKPPA